MSVHSIKRQRTLSPLELAELREQQTAGLVVDDLTGSVGDAEWERAVKAEAERFPLPWSALEMNRREVRS